ALKRLLVWHLTIERIAREERRGGGGVSRLPRLPICLEPVNDVLVLHLVPFAAQCLAYWYGLVRISTSGISGFMPAFQVSPPSSVCRNSTVFSRSPRTFFRSPAVSLPSSLTTSPPTTTVWT